MFKKILVVDCGILATGQAKQTAPARASVRATSREGGHV
jgi:hypothetical protein